MSSDNQTVCPRCQSIKQQEINAEEHALTKDYGKIDPLEWVERYQNIDKLKLSMESGFIRTLTLREDFELAIKNGVFTVSFNASCSVCGFKFNFNHSELIKIND